MYEIVVWCRRTARLPQDITHYFHLLTLSLLVSYLPVDSSTLLFMKQPAGEEEVSQKNPPGLIPADDPNLQHLGEPMALAVY
jgi:hypothetical protein